MISLARCRYRNSNTGALTLAPNGDKHLALVLLGMDPEGLENVISLAAPTIPPMTRSPVSEGFCLFIEKQVRNKGY